MSDEPESNRLPPKLFKLVVALVYQEVARRKWLSEHKLVRPGISPTKRLNGYESEAPREGPWWGVYRIGPHGRFSYRAMYRHKSLKLATREAKFQAEYYPGGVFAVVQMVSIHCIGEPEIKVKPEAIAALED